ncbi:hypothetical protein AAC387_Pa01g0067 [Persea americana]
MDLNAIDSSSGRKVQLISPYADNHISDYRKLENMADTTLTLDYVGYGAIKRFKTPESGNYESNLAHSSQASDDGCRLFLGLGPSPSCYADDYYPVGTVKNNGSVPVLGQWLPSDSDSEMLKLGLSRGSAEVPGLQESSASLQCEYEPMSLQNQWLVNGHIPIVDEGSTSAKRNSGGYMPALLLAPSLENRNVPKTQELLEHGTGAGAYHLQFSPEPSAPTDSSVGAISGPITSGASSEHCSHHPKRCRFDGCSKGARGASGLCIAHGGGQRCQKTGCNKGAESCTAFCKAHGGGRRCQHLGCTKSAEGKTDFCIAHGGGRRCGLPECTKAARGKSGLCIRHGGGKRCKVEGCSRSAEGQAGLCISHGGGRRCQHPGCTKGAQGSTMHCKAHGGGRRCVFAGCTKGAEGSTPLCKGHGGGKRCLYDGGGICPKSVHGGTDYCVAHGGGKRCAVPGCTKSARGRTDCCVRHGGGKRCQYENCGKSAQGSTDFCKAHGGGKRCAWGQGKCDKFARGRNGLCSAHGNMFLGQNAGRRGGMIDTSLFRGLVSESTVGSSSDNNFYGGASAVSNCVESSVNTNTRQLIPPQVLVPLSMKSSSTSRLMVDEREEEGSGGGTGRKSFSFALPEGRVHGGILMSLLKGDLKNIDNGL